MWGMTYENNRRDKNDWLWPVINYHCMKKPPFSRTFQREPLLIRSEIQSLSLPKNDETIHK